MNKKTLRVDPKKCISCGVCVSLASKSFEIDERDTSAPAVAKNPPQDNKEDIQLAIDTCPTAAIGWKAKKKT